jgi:hypothetical protein
MKRKTSWSRGEKQAAIAIVVAVIACASAFFIPEVRRFVGLEKPTVSTPITVTQAETPAPPPQTAPAAHAAKPVQIEQRGTGNGAAGSTEQAGNCNINQIGGNGNSASVNCGLQLRIPEQRIEQLAALLSARTGTVSIEVRNADGATNRDAGNLLAAFAKSRTWSTQGVNQIIHGTDIGADGQPIPDPVGIHLYVRSEKAALADFVRASLRAVGIESHEDIDENVESFDIRILVGASE